MASRTPRGLFLEKMYCGIVSLMLAAAPAATAQGDFFNNSPFPMMREPTAPQLQRTPLQLPKRPTTMGEIVPRVDYPVTFLPPLYLGGVKVPGLTTKSVQMLGQNFFVVVDNTKYTTMAEVYRDNRLRGKSNFVTADSIIHPYFAFTNRVIADTITEHILPDIDAMLKAMLEKASADYKQAEDAEVRKDIEHNLAYLAVAVKLIDPKYFPPIPLRVVPMVQGDLKAIHEGHGARSIIFDQVVDFSSFQPPGWYNSTPQLQSFFRCRQWITQMSFPFTDVTLGDKGSRGNCFRRSALLYRNLDLATIKGKPAFETWERLYKSWPLLGAQLKDWQESTISPLEYKAQVKTANADLKVTLNALAEPLFRTKLLLSVRKQKPLKLGAASVFDLVENKKSSGEGQVSFRLLPLAGDPEWPWLKACLTLAETQNEGKGCPFSLMVLHAWGAPQANNSLNDNYMHLDERLLARVLPDLDQMVMVKLPGGVVKPIDDRRWQILTGYFKPFPETSQSVTRTDIWMTRMLESAFAGWVDSHLAIMPPAAPKTDQAAAQPAEPAAQEEPTTTRKTKTPLFHYVQPSPEIFQKITEDANRLQGELTALGYLPDRYKDRFADFVRLAGRLQKMAELELKSQSLPLPDIKLLQNIDVILEQVELPTEGVLSLRSPNATLPNDQVGSHESGVNFGLGRPGQLFIILQDGANWTLGRGAVYTYYEMPGAPITAEHWRRKLDHDLLRPPFWADKFDTVQEISSNPKSVNSNPNSINSNPNSVNSNPKSVSK